MSFKLHALVMPTVFSGLTMSIGDFYLSKDDALAELSDMKSARAAANAGTEYADDDDDDLGFEHAEVDVSTDGVVTDAIGGQRISMSGDETAEQVLETITELMNPRTTDTPRG